MNLWDNNEIQFARLLCEIAGTQEAFDMPALCESMGLDRTKVEELFDRANAVWEHSKATYCSPDLKPIPKGSDVYLMDEFVESCLDGMFIDHDGFGYYAMEGKMSDLKVRPSDVTRGGYDPNWTYVVWYNR